MTARKQLDQNFKKFLQSIDLYKKKYSTANKEITLLAVSKTKPVSDIIELYQLGQYHFAESYLNEALAKIIQLKNIYQQSNKKQPELVWHFIGRMQSNKTRAIAENFAWVHSVDKLKIAERLNKQRPNELDKLNILIQVNIDQDPKKAGVLTDDIFPLAEQISKLNNIKLRGLMCILQLDDSMLNKTGKSKFDAQYKSFCQLKSIQDDLNKNHGLNLDTLSMGMSHDYEAAIAAGSNMLRIGSAIFGSRDAPWQ